MPYIRIINRDTGSHTEEAIMAKAKCITEITANAIAEIAQSKAVRINVGFKVSAMTMDIAEGRAGEDAIWSMIEESGCDFRETEDRDLVILF